MAKKQLDRRKFLTGLGGLALALPFLDRFAGKAHAAPSATGPKRIIVLAYPMGVPGGVWRPTANTGPVGTLTGAIAPLEQFKDRCLFISDIDNTMLGIAPGFVAGHAGKSECCLTGTLTTNAFPTTNTNHVNQVIASAAAKDGNLANAASIETIVGRHLKTTQALDSIDLAVDGARVRNATSPSASRFFFEGRNQPVTLEPEPKKAFDRLFATLPSGDPQAEAALRDLRSRNKSVLDAVRESYGDTARGLGTEDRRRLEEHAAKIRQIELDVTVGSCAQPTGILGSTAGQKMDTIAATQIKLMAQAMACNLAPLGRLEFTGQQNPRFGIPALDDRLAPFTGSGGNPYFDWHNVVHGDAFPGTTTRLRPNNSNPSAAYDPLLVAGYRFFVQQLANLMTELDKHPEGNGTVLDNTLLILASDLGEGIGHNHNKMGFVLAGNLGGAKRGHHFRCTPPASTTVGNFYTRSNFEVIQLLNSITDMAGMTDQSVGLQGYLSREGLTRTIGGLF